jgi:ECF sigma factor
MRRILVNHANARRASKRGGSNLRVTLNEEVAPGGGAPDDDILALDAALTELAQSDARRAAVVELHYFGGLTYPQIATALKLSPSTVHEDLRSAKATARRRHRGSSRASSIAAHADTWTYRAGKFLRRHAWGAATTLGVVLAIGGLVAFYTLRLAQERDRLARANATSEEFSAFLVGLFEDANPSFARPDVTARQVLEDGATRIEHLRDGAHATLTCERRSPIWRRR